MKILLVANHSSVHIKRWANSLADKGIDISIFDFFQYNFSDSEYKKKINIFTCNINNTFAYNKEGGFIKINYLKSLPYLRKIIKELKPDIIHSHYASSYGLLGALSNVHPYIVSVWGSDIYSFPKRSYFHRIIIKFILKRADAILSTSKAMSQEAQKYTKKDIKITPFGVDIQKFKPFKLNGLFKKNDIVIGTVKSLDYNYGIEYLIKAFHILVNKYPNMPLKLLIVGDGPLKKKLENSVEKLQIEGKTIFTGKVKHEDVPLYLNMLSIPVFLSNSESFGVSVIEASACEKPVVVSDVGGLPEVVENNVTGIIVPPQNPEKAAESIEKLLSNKDLRLKMGKAGRIKVKELYDWEENVSKIIEVYNRI